MLKPISSQDLRTLAENAIELVKIVRQWLPVIGDTETKSGSQRTAENWFRLAAEHYTVCERIRNPHKLHFDCRGAYYGPLSCSAAWFEIQSALDEIAVAYSLQGVSDESGCPHLPFEQDVPAVESGTLKRLELAADSIIKAIGDEPAAAETPDKPGPEFTKRADAQAAYFKVWAYVSKPGNSAKSAVQIAGATSVDKTMVGRILRDTRPPTPKELEPKRTTGKKR